MTRRITHLGIGWMLLLATAAPTLAQVQAEEPPEKSWVLSYFLVGLGVTLGLVSVCRMSKRQKEVRKPESK